MAVVELAEIESKLLGLAEKKLSVQRQPRVGEECCSFSEWLSLSHLFCVEVGN